MFKNIYLVSKSTFINYMKKFINFIPFMPFLLGNNNNESQINDNIEQKEENKESEEKNKFLGNKIKRNTDGSNNNIEPYTVVQQKEFNETVRIKKSKELFKNVLSPTNIKKNQINSRNFENKYSYKIISPDLANILIKIPEELKILEFTIENDGSNDWLDSTFLINDEKDTTFIGKIENIKIGALKIGQKKDIKIELKDLNLKPKEHQLVLNFSADGEIYGNKIYIKFEVVNSDVYNFRAIYDINEKVGSDEEIIKILKENPNFISAYIRLMSKFL